jgi:hypothetical protein
MLGALSNRLTAEEVANPGEWLIHRSRNRSRSSRVSRRVSCLRASSRAAFVKPPTETKMPTSRAPSTAMNARRSDTSLLVVKRCFTCTLIRGSFKPSGSEPASMSIPRSGPGGAIHSTWYSIASSKRGNEVLEVVGAHCF